MNTRCDGNCVIFSSQTGVNVASSLEKLKDYSEGRGREIRILKVEDALKIAFLDSFPDDQLRDDIESEYGMQYLLQKPKRLFFDLWRQALTHLATPQQGQSTTFLSLHPVFYHSESREFFIPVDVEHLRDTFGRAGLRAKLVISLIDDIYDVFTRLRAPNHMLHPPERKPAFDETVDAILDLMLLLDWRSKEIMAAEQIARAVGAAHFVLAVKHPLSVAHDLLFTEKIPVYVSHPISQIRRLEASGNSGTANKIKEEINALVRALGQSSKLIPFYPTTIDEYIVQSDGTDLLPRLRPRWPVGKPESLLYCPPTRPVNPLDPRNTYGGARQPRPSVVKAVSPLLKSLTDRIMMQIGARDRNLVEQSAGLVVFRPYFNGVPSVGVQKEVSYRTALVRYKVAAADQRLCVIANPDEDMLQFRLRFLVSALARTKVRGKAPTPSRLARVERSLMRRKETREAICAGSVTGDQLQHAAAPSINEFIFDGMPRIQEPLSGDLRIAARTWLNDQWDRLASQMNSLDELRDQLTNNDVMLNSRTVRELVERAESLFSASNRE